MDERQIVNKIDTFQQLESILAHLLQRERLKAIAAKLLVQTGPELLKDHADMLAIVKPRVQLDAMVQAIGIMAVQMQQDINLQLCGLAILGDTANDLNSDPLPLAAIPTLDDLAKGALAQLTQNLIPAIGKVQTRVQSLSQLVNQMPLVIILTRERVGRRGQAGGLPAARARSPASAGRPGVVADMGIMQGGGGAVGEVIGGMGGWGIGGGGQGAQSFARVGARGGGRGGLREGRGVGQMVAGEGGVDGFGAERGGAGAFDGAQGFGGGA